MAPEEMPGSGRINASGDFSGISGICGGSNGDLAGQLRAQDWCPPMDEWLPRGIHEVLFSYKPKCQTTI